MDQLDLLTATIADLQRLLSATEHRVISKHLVDAYLAQINRHDDYLRAVINVAPVDILYRRAELLDAEREHGKVRGPLHGIPITLKDNIATNFETTGLDTTAGSFALVGSRPRENAVIVTKLLEAGAIIIAKASLSEFCWWKGISLINGWNAIRGQAQSPYVRGGVQMDDVSCAGHSNPLGSSSGSATSTAAGYAPASIGTETFGSLVLPAGRTSLFSLKPTRGIVSTHGIVPISRFGDAPGPMAKTTAEVAVLLDVLVDASKTRVPENGYASCVTGSWEGLRIGALDPNVWKFPPQFRKVLDPGMEQQLITQVLDTYAAIRKHVAVFHDNLPLGLPSTLVLDGEMSFLKVFEKDFPGELEEYLKLCESPKVTNLKELVQFNKDHADIELPKGLNGQQARFETCLNSPLADQEYEKYKAHAVKYGKEMGVDEMFDDYNINVIIAPAEAFLSDFAACAGYPIASMPAGYLNYNGRPHGLVALARAHREDLLIQLQSAFEKTFPKRMPPTAEVMEGRSSI
ncbi:amidase signature domain-containing protein [Podospora australis]|uniref:Amidase signature domain-containing protein n=1 Tax=Podospora australis TaxID=1536484 RepID=A0AAN6WIN8_9PEZI|nr:amidase signature domain-containing protein [Podospora australis]